MIEDLRGRPSGAVIEADICIVGAGVAGITIARELIASGLQVCLAESGGLSLEADTQALYQGVSVGHAVALDEGRYRVFGGASTRWTGRCARFDPIDFETRSWIALSGWPLKLDDLAAHYDRATRLCGFAATWRDDTEVLSELGGPDFNGAGIAPALWRFAPQDQRGFLDWGKAYRDDLQRAANVRVLLHANLTDIEPGADGESVAAIVLRSLDGRFARVKARSFVLACGGIENARVLLASPLGAAGAAGNRYDQVGRCFMQHARGVAAMMEASPEGARRLQSLFNVFPGGPGVEYEVGFALAPGVQRRERLLNCSGVLAYDPEPNSSWEAAKAALRDIGRFRINRETLAHMRRSLHRFEDVTENARRRLSGQRAFVSPRAIKLVLDLEQAPDPESRVMLDTRTDALGAPRAMVDWRVSEQERATARAFTERLSAAFAHAGLGHLAPKPWLTSTAPITHDDLWGTYHHMGATRMSADPRMGVVDRDCRLHGVRNLFLAGSSVFPTGGHANPTLTIAALALRLAGRLRWAGSERVASAAPVRAERAGARPNGAAHLEP